MEYTEEMYIEDLRISNYVYKKHFAQSTVNQNYKPELIQESLCLLLRARTNYNSELGTYAQLAFKTSYLAMRNYCITEINKDVERGEISLDSPMSKFENTQTLGDTISAKYDIEDNLKLEMLKNRCRELCNKFRSKQLKIVVEYFINGFNQTEISKIMGVSRQRVGQCITMFREVAKKELKKDL